MSRKKTISGGKRDEIIEKAMLLFIENGYEGTSIRMILDAVGGEIGMFYYYFKSKEEIFDLSAQYFMDCYVKKFEESILNEKLSFRQKIIQLAAMFQSENDNFHKLIANKMHWTISTALHQVTLNKIKPMFTEVINNLYINAQNEKAQDISEKADFLLMGLSGLIHNTKFQNKNISEQLNMVASLFSKVLDIPIEKLN